MRINYYKKAKIGAVFGIRRAENDRKTHKMA
jgi:hypothetical protein